MNTSKLQDDVIAYAPGALAPYFLYPQYLRGYLCYVSGIVAGDVLNLGPTLKMALPLGLAYYGTGSLMGTAYVFVVGYASQMVMYKVKDMYTSRSSSKDVQATSKVYDL